MPDISVIIPCYNVEKYIKPCLDCVVAQTLPDIEIICIDDKSTDNTLNALRQYAADSGDKRIKIIEMNLNVGVADARNAGLDVAQGNYIGFLDPDDTIDDDFFHVLYERALGTNADIVKGIATVVDIDKTLRVVNNNFQIAENKFNFDTCFWTAIYKRKLIHTNNIRFPSGFLIAEDLIFLIQAVYYAKTIETTDEVTYWYYRRENSLDSNVLSPQKLESGVSALKYIITWANQHQDMGTTAYQHILLQVYNIAMYLSIKQLTISDKNKLCRAMIWVYQNSQDKKFMNKIYKRKILGPIKRSDPENLYKQLFVENTRLRPFGIIPLIKISLYDGKEMQIKLFDIITVINIRRIPHKTKIYFCGILIITIKR